MKWLLVLFWVHHAGIHTPSMSSIPHHFKTQKECKVFLESLRQDHPNFHIDGSCLPVDAASGVN